VPADLPGRILMLGYLGLGLLGLAGLLAGNAIASLYLLAAVLGYLLIDGRLLAVVIWTLVALAGVAGAQLGNQADWLQAGLGTVLVATAVFRLASRTSTPGEPAAESVAAATAVADRQPRPAPAAPEALDSSELAEFKSLIRVRTIGRFAVTVEGVDLTSEILERPAVGFMWTYLLARALLQPGARILRTVLADELSPGLPLTQQRRKLRSLLYHAQHDPPLTLRSRLQVETMWVGFQLKGCETDFQKLRNQADGLPNSGELLDDQRMRELEGTVEELGEGDFLPHFEEIEETITGGRGSAGDTVRGCRAIVNQQRERLLTVLADNYLARRQPDRCVRLLEPMVKEGTASEEFVHRLIDAYIRNMQPALASELSRRYSGDLKEEAR
jgi:hypothetical protein